jgi:hypothetical protein
LIVVAPVFRIANISYGPSFSSICFVFDIDLPVKKEANRFEMSPILEGMSDMDAVLKAVARAKELIRKYYPESVIVAPPELCERLDDRKENVWPASTIASSPMVNWDTVLPGLTLAAN